MQKKPFEFFRFLGPGFVVAATGVGAGDMIAATVAGARFGIIILWSALLGAVLKYVLNEGIARWQLTTGESLIQAWKEKFKKGVSYYFIGYLFLWSFIVSGALISACGLAAHSIFPGLSISAWGMIHSVVAVILVLFGRYVLIENIMKFFIALMFFVIIYSAIVVRPDLGSIIEGLTIPRMPRGSAKFILGVIGGVGGSVTLLSYGYWIKEKHWQGRKFLKTARIDLFAAYFFTGIFVIAIMIIAARVQPEKSTGSRIVLAVADQLALIVGESGRWIFLIGFWGAVFSSMLGVWQGIPYLFSDFMHPLAKKTGSSQKPRSRSMHYRIFLFYLGFPPMLLLLFKQPVWIVIIYSIAGAFFMPFLAGTLLLLNNQHKWVMKDKNGWLTNLFLLISLLLFLYILGSEVYDKFF